MRRDTDIQGFLRDPNVREVMVLGPTVGVMALHGGLEFSTSRIARAVAHEAPASFYGVVQSPDLGWHVPSIHFTRAATQHLGAFLDQVSFVVSLHGFHRKTLLDTILLGGSNRQRASELGAKIRAAGYPVESDLNKIPSGLRGLHPQNPVNLASRGGVQVELPRLYRRPKPLAGIVGAISEVLRNSTQSPRPH